MTSTQTHSTGTLQGSLLNHSQGAFTGANQIKLFYQSWYPAAIERAAAEDTSDALPVPIPSPAEPLQKQSSKIKGVLAIVHGLGEHSGRYCSVVKAATSAGYAVFGFDNQGHGKSEGQRGHIRSWQDYRDNVQAFLQLIRAQEPAAPLFVMGHSLGGLIVLDYALHSAQADSFKALQVQGIVISAPPMKPVGGKAHSARAILAKLLSGLLPRFTLKMCLDEGGLSRDREIEAQAQKDPLVHPYVTLRWGAETISTIEWVKRHIGELKLPIMLTHGGADPLIDPAGSTALFEDIAAPEKTLRIYPGSYHEPHNDLDVGIVTADIITWIEQTLEGS